MNQRERIFRAIYDILENNIFLNDVLLKYVFDDKNVDKAYLKRSISGILENKILIDHIISKYSNTKIQKIDKKVYYILLCAIYEFLFMDNSKQYALINEYVALIKKYKTQFHANFTNAILRSISKNETKNKIFKDDNIHYSIKYSIPKNLYEYLKTNINVDTNIDKCIENLFKYYYDNDYISFRINNTDENSIKQITKEFTEKNIEYFIYDKSLKIDKLKCIIAKNINDLSAIKCFNDNLISVQDISSIYYIDKLYSLLDKDLIKNISVLDACASPGGKSIAFLEAFNKYNINLYSCDKSEKKLKKITQNFDKLKHYIKYNNLHILTNDAMLTNEDFINKFDIVLLDVPCSGLGIISKKQDIKYNFDESKVNDLINIQKTILNTNKIYIKENGYLCYSTCTINRLENDDMIKEFLSNNINFKLIYKEQIISSKDNFSDGFYFAIIERIT